MSGERAAIQAPLNSHPSLSISAKGHAIHAERYVSATGRPIGFEPERNGVQSLEVGADDVSGAKLPDSPNRFYDVPASA